jgi:large subunit ribosomal protein L18
VDKSKFLYRQRLRRTHRVRKRLKGVPERPRLSVNRTQKHIYCQVIDDVAGTTLVSASSREKELATALSSGSNKDAAIAVGKALAARVKAAGITALCFDRGCYRYHGRVAALADAVRESGVAM